MVIINRSTANTEAGARIGGTGRENKQEKSGREGVRREQGEEDWGQAHSNTDSHGVGK